MQRVGIVGLGNMGMHMARNLVRHGFELTVFDLKPELVSQMTAIGAKSADSLKDLAENNEIIYCMLANHKQYDSVLLGEGGLFSFAPAGRILICTGTLAPKDMREYYAEAQKHGIEMVDSPVSGGVARAQDGTMCLMAACTDEVWEKAKDVIYAVGSEAIHVDQHPGNGQVFKAANQMFVYGAYCLTAEVMMMTEGAGVDPWKMKDVIIHSRGNNVIFEKNVDKYIKRSFTLNGRADIGLKDLNIIQDIAKDFRFPAPVSAACLEIFKKANEDGWGAEDNTIVMKEYEKLAGEMR